MLPIICVSVWILTGRIELEFGKRRLLDHLVVAIDGLQFHHQSRAPFAPDSVPEPELVPRFQLHHIGVKAGNAILADHMNIVEIRDGRIGGAQQIREQFKVFALLAFDNL